MINNSEPLLRRTKIATIGASDLERVEECYGEWLGYTVVERGTIEAKLAHLWDAPEMAHRPYILLQPASRADAFIRAALIDPVPGYRGLTTFGWAAFELIVEDVYALQRQLASSPFRVVGPAQSLGGDLERIHAMQVIGPAEEVLYLTCDTGPDHDSILPRSGTFVGHVFIAIVAGASVDALLEFYGQHFQVARSEVRDTRTKVINDALSFPAATRTPMTYMPLGLPGNFLQMDGYPPPARNRPCAAGQLPPGNAGIAFTTGQLSGFTGNQDRQSSGSLAYSGRPSTALRGPAGELIELVQETG